MHRVLRLNCTKKTSWHKQRPTVRKLSNKVVEHTNETFDKPAPTKATLQVVQKGEEGRLNPTEKTSWQRQPLIFKKIRRDQLVRYSDEAFKKPEPTKATVHLVRNVKELRERRALARLQGREVAFIPTMGSLHEGHLCMIRDAARNHSEVYVSIYVNPAQFGPKEDIETYPRTLNKDIEALYNTNESLDKEQALGRVTTIFYPTTSEMYPGLPPSSDLHGVGCYVTINPLGQLLEGSARPIFFRGVATVCMKLFNIVQPDDVYFGQKDIQQCIIIHRMIQAFHIDIRFHMQPTSREPDGLALSSRNVYLGTRRRAVANVLAKAIQAGSQTYWDGKRSRPEIVKSASKVLSESQEAQRRLPPAKRALFEVDYLSLLRPDTLRRSDSDPRERAAILNGAITMQPLEEPQEGEDTGLGGGKTTVRLLDNAVLRPPGESLEGVLLGV